MFVPGALATSTAYCMLSWTDSTFAIFHFHELYYQMNGSGAKIRRSSAAPACAGRALSRGARPNPGCALRCRVSSLGGAHGVMVAGRVKALRSAHLDPFNDSVRSIPCRRIAQGRRARATPDLMSRSEQPPYALSTTPGGSRSRVCGTAGQGSGAEGRGQAGGVSGVTAR